MAKKSRIKIHDLSRIIIYIIGHNPHEYGLVPDNQGFISIKELLWALHEEQGWSHVSQGSINELLMSEERDHFEVNENMIRAKMRRWKLDLDLPADYVPSLLYTPVRRRAHYNAIDKGLVKSDNNTYVLTANKEMAERIGKRKDQKPVILEIMASRASDEGTLFYSFGDLFLTEEILPGYIAGPPVPKDVIKQRETRPEKKKDAALDFSAGTFTLDINRDPDMARRKKGKKKKGWREEMRGKRRKG